METSAIKMSPFTGFYRHGECILLQMRVDDAFKAILETLRTKPDNQEFLKNAVTEFYLRYPFNMYDFNRYVSDMLGRAENYLKKYHPEIVINDNADKPLPYNYFLNVLPNPTTINLSSPKFKFNPTIRQENYNKFISAISLDNPCDNKSPYVKSYEITKGTNGTHYINGRGMRYNQHFNRNDSGQLLPAEATQTLNEPIPTRLNGLRGVLFVPYSATIEYTPHDTVNGVKNHNDINVDAGVYLILTMSEYTLDGTISGVVD